MGDRNPRRGSKSTSRFGPPGSIFASGFGPVGPYSLGHWRLSISYLCKRKECQGPVQQSTCFVMLGTCPLGLL